MVTVRTCRPFQPYPTGSVVFLILLGAVQPEKFRQIGTFPPFRFSEAMPKGRFHIAMTRETSARGASQKPD